MTIDAAFNGEAEAKAVPKDKGKKRAATKVNGFNRVPLNVLWSSLLAHNPFKAALKRAETVCIPYALVPGMDTKSRIFLKATAIENAKAGASSNKRARTEPPFIDNLADLQRRQGTLFPSKAITPITFLTYFYSF